MKFALLFLLAASPALADDKCVRQCCELIKEVDKQCRTEKDDEGQQACLRTKGELKKECEDDCRKAEKKK